MSLMALYSYRNYVKSCIYSKIVSGFMNLRKLSENQCKKKKAVSGVEYW